MFRSLKRIAKTLSIFSVILLTTLSLAAQTVYITKTGQKYHSDGCQYLRKSSFAITLQEAINTGYTPCSRCDPPTQVNTVKKIHENKQAVSSRCMATTKKGSRCKRAAAEGSKYCWQHQ